MAVRRISAHTSSGEDIAVMSRPQTRYRLFLLLTLLGIHAQVAQALLVRESLVAFYGNEVSVGAFYGGWLFWIALGSLAAVSLRNRPALSLPSPLLRAILLALPLLLAGQLLAVRGIRLVLDVSPTEFIPLGQVFLSILVLTLPSGLALGLAFPLACRALRSQRGADADLAGTVSGVSYLYIFDALGALLGGLLFTFVLVEWLGVWRSLGAVTAALALSSLLLPGGSRRGHWIAGLLGVSGLVFAATPLGSWVDGRMEAFRFAGLQPGLDLEEAVETRYGHVAVGRIGSQFSVVEDGRIAESFPNREEVQQEAAFVYAQSSDARRVLMFGGLAGGLAAELLRYPLQRLELVVQDRRAFERLRPYLGAETLQALEDPRLRVHFQDGRRFANRLSGREGYDLVLVLRADPSNAHSNRYFTQDFYQQVRQAMAAGGVLCTAVSSASNYLGADVKSYSGSVFRTLAQTFPYVAIAPGDSHLYCAAAAPGRVSEDPSVLERRYLAVPLDQHRFPALSFFSLLPADRIEFVRSQLSAETGELNSDARPVTYYLNMLLWGRFTGSLLVEWLEKLRSLGPWPYLLPPGLLVLLMLARAGFQGFRRPRLQRQAATLALALLGLIAMAVQLVLLFSYQAQLGFMFSRLALLNGVFMTGLALGAGAVGQYLARSREPGLLLAGLMGLVAVGLLGLPSVLSGLAALDAETQEAVYLGLCLLAGLLTGAGFPLGLAQTHADTGELLSSSGLAEAADSLGGALGGLVTGALLVPLLGVEGSCRVLALLALIGLPALLYARFAPERQASLQARSYASFPYAPLTWTLTWLVLCVYLLTLLGRGAGSEPTLYFDQTALAEVTGSTEFELREQPIPHYLGRGSSEDGRTVALATMAAAPQVRGYAGPINLLIGVDEQGRLSGVRYLDSDETPSYIFGIQGWLQGLVGSELSREPLSLARVDAMSGATVSSHAAIESINRAARVASAAAFGRTLPGAQGQAPAWRSPRFLVTLGLLLLFFPVYLSGSETARLVYQGLVLVGFGFWLNTLVTEMDLVNLSLGRVSDLADNPQRWLLLGFVLVATLLFGQVWCGYCCPFGALQEFFSRLGRFLYLRSYVERPLDQRLRLLKYLLLALMLLAVWGSGDVLWAGFDPMQHLFGGHVSGWLALIAAISLGGALVYYRFWCRYFCPVGALLALGNKLALLGRWAPKRRFEHCDLGVRHEFDVDCIRCSRCLTGRDFGQREPRRR
jgi:spermidine synthase